MLIMESNLSGHPSGPLSWMCFSFTPRTLIGPLDPKLCLLADSGSLVSVVSLPAQRSQFGFTLGQSYASLCFLLHAAPFMVV